MTCSIENTPEPIAGVKRSFWFSLYCLMPASAQSSKWLLVLLYLLSDEWLGLSFLAPAKSTDCIPARAFGVLKCCLNPPPTGLKGDTFGLRVPPWPFSFMLFMNCLPFRCFVIDRLKCCSFGSVRLRTLKLYLLLPSAIYRVCSAVSPDGLNMPCSYESMIYCLA